MLSRATVVNQSTRRGCIRKVALDRCAVLHHSPKATVPMHNRAYCVPSGCDEAGQKEDDLSSPGRPRNREGNPWGLSQAVQNFKLTPVTSTLK